MKTRMYMKDDSSFESFPTYLDKAKPGSRKILVGMLFLLVLAGLVVAGLYVLGVQSRKPQVSMTKSSPTPTPTATPTPQLQRKDLSVSVLNGSGKPGAANGMSAALSDLGYHILRTGNADNFNYTQTTIKISKEKQNYLEMLKADVAKQANAGSVSATVVDTLTPDAVVIVAK